MAKENEDVNAVKRALVIAITSAFLGGAGGPVLFLKFTDGEFLRPDPFTGAEGDALARRITALERHMETRYDEHDRRITTLEVQYQNIIGNQEKIIARLDVLRDK